MSSTVGRVRIFVFGVLVSAGLAAFTLQGCGGSSGGGGADACGPCVKASACCTAYENSTGGDPSSCSAFATACQSATGSTRDQLVTQCQAFTMQTATRVPSPTECR
jgi:hypothetical protein